MCCAQFSQPIWEDILRDYGWSFPEEIHKSNLKGMKYLSPSAGLKAVIYQFPSSVLVLNSPHPWLAQLLTYLI